jgi:Leucine-rich repeat (LRR) protein
MFCSENVKMVFHVFLTIFLLVLVSSSDPSITIQCDAHNYTVTNMSGHSFPLHKHVHKLVMEECQLENIPDILSKFQPHVNTVSMMKHHLVKSFPNDYQCNPRLKSVARVKLFGTGRSVSGDYSAVLGYLSQCTSVIDLEILDTIVKQIMRLESCQTLQSLRLTNNHISELQMEDFQALTKLRVLDLARNKLVRIPSRVFTNNRRLSRLCLARNAISFITRQSFLGRISDMIYIIQCALFQVSTI